jgi:preprotein translocase subunit Sec61beta
MASPFEMVINKLLDIGFYDFLIFLLALPLFFALLKKTKVLGESTATNGLVAFIGAFLIFSFPIITGVSLTFSLTNMFMQFMMFLILIFFALVISSFFYPDMLELFKEKFTSRTMLYVGLAIGLTVAIISGFLPTVLQGVASSGAPSGPQIDPDITNLVGATIIFIVVLIIAAATTMSGK